MIWLGSAAKMRVLAFTIIFQFFFCVLGAPTLLGAPKKADRLASNKQGHLRQLLIGSWQWSEHQLSEEDIRNGIIEKGIFTFTFDQSGSLETSVFLPNGRGKGNGEGLGSSGRYRLQYGRLIVTRAHEPADGWPSRSGEPPHRYDCGIRMAADEKTFELADCPISGLWVRQLPH